MLISNTLQENIIAVLAISFISTLFQYFMDNEMLFFQTFVGTAIGMSIAFSVFYIIEKKIDSFKKNRKDRNKIE